MLQKGQTSYDFIGFSLFNKSDKYPNIVQQSCYLDKILQSSR